MYSLSLPELKIAENVIFPIEIEGNLVLSKLEKAERIILPQTYIDGGIILSKQLDSANGLIFRYNWGGFPQTIINRRYIYEGLNSYDGQKLPDRGSVNILGAKDEVLESLKERYPYINFF